MFTHPVISADGHIDLPCLPASLFTDNAPASLKDKMPKVVDKPEGKTWVSHQGTSMGLVGGMGSAGRQYVPGQIYRADRMAETGLYEDQSRGVMRTAVPSCGSRTRSATAWSAKSCTGCWVRPAASMTPRSATWW